MTANYKYQRRIQISVYKNSRRLQNKVFFKHGSSVHIPDCLHFIYAINYQVKYKNYFYFYVSICLIRLTTHHCF